ncbi:MAG: glutathione peroxidase, partial [Verrucomicrobiales bacterium]
MKFFTLALIAALSPIAAGGALLDHEVKDIDGETVSLSEKYKGRVILVVNVASKCGHTRQYEQLQKLHDIFADQGLSIVAFPSNDFGGQEPGSEAEIKEFCSSNFGVTFDLMSKVAVKGGDEQLPFFTALTSDPKFPGEIKWNFEKFVIGRDGKLAN